MLKKTIKELFKVLISSVQYFHFSSGQKEADSHTFTSDNKNKVRNLLAGMTDVNLSNRFF